jgi:DTW domain-containing protein YfiP
MDSPFSEAKRTVADLREAARRGDWNTANVLAVMLSQQRDQEDREALAEYILDLKDALSVARASRAHAAASLARLNAAAGFHRVLPCEARQNIANPPDL